MINLNTFIKKCEEDLTSKRRLSENTLILINDLSERDKTISKPILDFISKRVVDIDDERNKGIIDVLPEERILVCRLIPLLFSLDTHNPTWSSYMLTQAIESASNVAGIKLSEIGISFLEIFCEFATPLNTVVYNFCRDISREFTANYRKRLDEFEPLDLWGNPYCKTIASVAFLRYCLPYPYQPQPEFVLETMVALIQNEYFEELIGWNKYLFEDVEYKKEFQECLLNSGLSDYNRSIIFSVLGI